jgi:hypothetical protein
MHVEQINRPIFELPDNHPTKRFLQAFINCYEQCVGRELDWPDQQPIDQCWTSRLDERTWTFSAFAYEVLAFDVELDGYLTAAPQLTGSELDALRNIPTLRTLMHECADAARASENQPIVDLTCVVLEMLDLWEQCIRYRERELGTG